MPGDRVAVVRRAVQQGGPAVAVHSLQELQHGGPVALAVRHETQDVLRALRALRHGVPEEHPAGDGQAGPGRGRRAVVAEARKVAEVAEVVRGHGREPAGGVPRQHAQSRGALVGRQGVQGERLGQPGVLHAGAAGLRRQVFVPARAI